MYTYYDMFLDMDGCGGKEWYLRIRLFRRKQAFILPPTSVRILCIFLCHDLYDCVSYRCHVSCVSCVHTMQVTMKSAFADVPWQGEAEWPPEATEAYRVANCPHPLHHCRCSAASGCSPLRGYFGHRFVWCGREGRDRGQVHRCSSPLLFPTLSDSVLLVLQADHAGC